MLEIANITKTFHPGTPNEVRALRDVSLRLEAGSFLIIIGTNGSGKSTLLNAVAGTFLVDEGQIGLAGHSITRWSEHQRAKLIGRVFQNPFSGTAPNMSIAENLAPGGPTRPAPGPWMGADAQAQAGTSGPHSHLEYGVGKPH